MFCGPDSNMTFRIDVHCLKLITRLDKICLPLDDSALRYLLVAVQ